MDGPNRAPIKILFSQAHKEQLIIAEDVEGDAQPLPSLSEEDDSNRPQGSNSYYGTCAGHSSPNRGIFARLVGRIAACLAKVGRLNGQNENCWPQGDVTESEPSALRQMLAEAGHVTDYTTEALTSDLLADARVLVIGAPRDKLEPAEIEVVEQFVKAGGGLLLASNAETMMMIDPVRSLNQLAAIANMEFQEYLNYPPTYFQVFWPHYITANVGRVRVGGIASLELSDETQPLARTKATKQEVMACANVGRGRVVAIGDIGLFADDLLFAESNQTLATNVFRWLAALNDVDIEKVTIPEIVKWGQSTTVVLQLRNSDTRARPQVECVLESDADALIEPARKRRSIPPGKTTRMQWTVRPQILGEQELRLAVHIDGGPLFFDQLPKMCCHAPGYFTLEIKDKDGELKTAFETGDNFVVEGTFHQDTESELLSYQLKLEFDEGLVERGYEQGHGVDRWHLQATAKGAHKLVLSLTDEDGNKTGQSLPALVTVKSSAKDQLGEIYAAYVRPLEAEIAERLRQVDESLSHEQIMRQPFKVLPPGDFVEAVYKEESVSWLKGMLAAARREQWHNPELLDLVLTHIAPTYLPNHGSFIPYDPVLASHLSGLHHKYKGKIEYNLLCSGESTDINIKQNIAAYLLHEKFGHGFFYTQTRLGQQLAILQRHEYPEEYKEAVELIRDSATITNEGFAAWMELTFLDKLDREIREAVYPRQMLLIQEAIGLYELKRKGGFFQEFPPRFDSRYREGFEYLEFIGKKFNLRCAVRAFMLATNVDFGIVEDANRRLDFELDPSEIEDRLLKRKEHDWRSHLRLREIVKLLYEHDEEAKKLTRKQYCPADCRENACPLEIFIEERLQYRIYD